MKEIACSTRAKPAYGLEPHVAQSVSVVMRMQSVLLVILKSCFMMFLFVTQVTNHVLVETLARLCPSLGSARLLSIMSPQIGFPRSCMAILASWASRSSWPNASGAPDALAKSIAFRVQECKALMQDISRENDKHGLCNHLYFLI